MQNKYGHEKCMSVDCGHGAKIVPKLCVPGVGARADIHTPMSGIIGLKLCEECFAALKAKPIETVLTDEFKKIFSILARGMSPPDFDRAYLERVLISSKEYQTYDRLTESKGGTTVH